jgi:hypothetical protein
MGIQQATESDSYNAKQGDWDKAKFCMAIIWVKSGENELDKVRLIQSMKNTAGVSDANFTTEKPAVLLVDYCTKEVKAARLVEKINSMGIFARIVGY